MVFPITRDLLPAQRKGQLVAQPVGMIGELHVTLAVPGTTKGVTENVLHLAFSCDRHDTFRQNLEQVMTPFRGQQLYFVLDNTPFRTT